VFQSLWLDWVYLHRQVHIPPWKIRNRIVDPTKLLQILWLLSGHHELHNLQVQFYPPNDAPSWFNLDKGSKLRQHYREKPLYCWIASILLGILKNKTTQELRLPHEFHLTLPPLVVNVSPCFWFLVWRDTLPLYVLFNKSQNKIYIVYKLWGTADVEIPSCVHTISTSPIISSRVSLQWWESCQGCRVQYFH
jgi:hypothetical protein